MIHFSILHKLPILAHRLLIDGIICFPIFGVRVIVRLSCFLLGSHDCTLSRTVAVVEGMWNTSGKNSSDRMDSNMLRLLCMLMHRFNSAFPFSKDN